MLFEVKKIFNSTINNTAYHHNICCNDFKNVRSIMVNKERKNKNLASLILAIPVFMFILAYLSVPLYDLFCKVTGYGGTTQDMKRTLQR